jgi:hypothetical protein
MGTGEQHIPDVIDRLNGRPLPRMRATRAAIAYVNDPTEANRDLPREAYFAASRQRRLGGNDTHDSSAPNSPRTAPGWSTRKGLVDS